MLNIAYVSCFSIETGVKGKSDNYFYSSDFSYDGGKLNGIMTGKPNLEKISILAYHLMIETIFGILIPFAELCISKYLPGDYDDKISINNNNPLSYQHEPNHIDNVSEQFEHVDPMDNQQDNIEHQMTVFAINMSLQEHNHSLSNSNIDDHVQQNTPEADVDNYIPHSIPETDQNCVVCLENKKMYAVQPCGHMAYCKDCHHQIVKKNVHKCPICRREAKTYQAIFL